MHRRLRGDDNSDGIGIGSVSDGNGSGRFYGILNGS